MGSVESINQYKNNEFMAGQCQDKAVIYEAIHDKLNEAYTKLYLKHGASIELGDLQDTAKNYLTLADSEWLAKRKYEKGED
jgi:hypothetical protein